jgi:hypothetical protein
MSSGYFERPPVPRKLQKLSSSSDLGRYDSDERGDREEENPFNDLRSSTVPMSINGLESVDALVPDSDPSMALSSLALRDSQHTFKDEDFDKAVEKVWDEMGNK